MSVIQRHDFKADVTAFDAALAAADVASTTRRAYVGDARRFLTWMSGRARRAWTPESVTPIDVVAYREHLTKTAACRAASVNRSLASLRRFFAWLRELGRIDALPTEKLRGIKVMRSTAPAALAAREVHALLRAARGTGWRAARIRNTTLLQIFLQTGLRLAELRALKWQDLSLRPKSGILRVREGKGGKERVLPLNRTARKALSDWKSALSPEKTRDAEHVFASSAGKPLAARTLQHLLAELARRGHVADRNVTPHALRHTFATDYLERHPGDLVGLAALLGHESIATTAIYTKPTAESLADKVESLPLNAYDS